MQGGDSDMLCQCGGKTVVLETRVDRRRRACKECLTQVWTVEQIDESIKLPKVKAGTTKIASKRPVRQYASLNWSNPFEIRR